MKQWLKAVFDTRRRWTWKTEGARAAQAVCLYEDAYNEKKKKKKKAAWAGLAVGSMAYHSQMKVAMRA